jgi:hypothetical protein
VKRIRIIKEEKEQVEKMRMMKRKEEIFIKLFNVRHSKNKERRRGRDGNGDGCYMELNVKCCYYY